jgi:hypothetical protein
MTEGQQPRDDAAVEDAQEDLPARFSIVAGGPFHVLLRRLRLLEGDGLPGRRAAVSLALVAWLIPALLVAAQSLLVGRYSGWDYFEDATVYARYLVSIYAMIITERLADGRIVLLTRYFRDAGLFDVADRARFSAAVRAADGRSSSRTAELIILVFAVVWSVVNTRYSSLVSADSWEGVVTVGGGVTLSWGGEASAFTSNTLFLFLLLRWFWRFFLWAGLLRRAAALDLRVMPLHPDRCGGLGFLAIFPGIFTGLVFALSCVIGAALLKAAPVMGDSEQLVWLAIAIWLVLVMLVFLGPLLVFVRPLYLARERAMLEYGRLVHGHHTAFHSRWFDTDGTELLGSPDPSSVSDLNASVDNVYGMSLFPVDRSALVLLVGSAAVPLLVAAAFRMPIGDLLGGIINVIL